MSWRRARRAETVAMLGGALVFWAKLAAAQHTSVAEALFRDARAAMKRSDYASACPKFAESLRLDPSPGTLFNLAFCEERQGRTASAWTRFHEFVDTASKNDPRRIIALREIAVLEPHLPRLRISIADGELGAVLLDSVELRAAGLSNPIPVDPGLHVVELRRTGLPVEERRFQIEKAELLEVRFEREQEVSPTVAPAKVRTTPSLTRQSRAPEASVRSRRSSRHSELTAAYVAGGLGLAGVVGAGVFGALAYQKKQVSMDHCDEKDCDSKGLAAARDGDRFLRLVDVAGAVGAAGLAVSVVLFWRSNQRVEMRQVAGGGGAVFYTGQFR